MKRYILKRIFQSVICLIGVTMIIFFLTRLSGDPVLLMVPPEATKAGHRGDEKNARFG